MSDLADIIGLEARMEGLTNDGETHHDHIHMDDSESCHWVLALRSWDHPNAEDAHIISLRYAKLARDGQGHDGWDDKGVNMRVPAGVDPADALDALAQMFTSGKEDYEGDDSPVRSLSLGE